MDYREMRAKVHALSLRERAIVTIGICALFIALWLQLFFDPLQKESKRQRSILNAVNSEIVELSEKIAVLAGEASQDPNRALYEEQASLTEELDNLEQKIREELGFLVAPEKMAEFLHSILADFKGLEIISAKNLPVETVGLSDVVDNTALGNRIEAGSDNQLSESLLFAHRFEMVFEGSYFPTLLFVEKLEGMEGLLWEEFEYKVDVYPRAQVKIVLKTISLDSAWIGV